MAIEEGDILEDDGETFITDSEHVYSEDFTMNEDLVLYYDWLMDSATTSHICNDCEAFATYKPLTNVPIQGVGGLKVHAEGCGTVRLQSHVKGTSHMLLLDKVLYVPSNRNNLIALGRWDKLGCKYVGQNGKIHLYTAKQQMVAVETKLQTTYIRCGLQCA